MWKLESQRPRKLPLTSVYSNVTDLTMKSQLGFHDSELAIIMEDSRLLRTTMDGEPYEAGHHVATLRRQLWLEHLGILPAQPLDASEDGNAQPPGDCPNDFHQGPESEFVADPLSDQVWDRWTAQANRNTEIFRRLFRADPDDHGMSSRFRS